jgi:hypothetical protein
VPAVRVAAELMRRALARVLVQAPSGSVAPARRAVERPVAAPRAPVRRVAEPARLAEALGRRCRWPGPRRRARRWRRCGGRTRQLGRDLHRESAFADATLLGQQPHVSQRRSRRFVDAHQRRPHARARSARDPDHGQSVGSSDDRRLQQRDHDTEHDRLVGRIAVARRLALRRDRRWQPAGHGRRRQELAQNDAVCQHAGRLLRVGCVRLATRRQRGVRIPEQLAAR